MEDAHPDWAIHSRLDQLIRYGLLCISTEQLCLHEK